MTVHKYIQNCIYSKFACEQILYIYYIDTSLELVMYIYEYFMCFLQTRVFFAILSYINLIGHIGHTEAPNSN